jgi:hypothetical protein
MYKVARRSRKDIHNKVEKEGVLEEGSCRNRSAHGARAFKCR